MPNYLAYLVFYSTPFLVWILLRKYPLNKAIFLSVLLVFLFVPVEYSVDLPLLPPIDKESIVAVSLMLCIVLKGIKFNIFSAGPVSKFLILLILSMIITVELNGDSIVKGGALLRGLTEYDAFSDVVRLLIWLSPIVIGRLYFTDIKGNPNLFVWMVVSALIYTIPMLYEIRMSPQLHNQIYGYAPSSFLQQIREGGFRPIVFVGHGLPLAFWFSTCVISAAILLKNRVRVISSPWMVLIYMFVMLLLCKTWSAMIYAVAGYVLVMYVNPTKQVKIALFFAAFVLLYPVTKAFEIFPSKEIVEAIKEVSPERAQSLEVRFENEDVLSEHIAERPLFGWGGSGRNRVYSNTGKDITITDGRWIIVYSYFGQFGFFLFYAIVLTPLYYAVKSIKYIEDPRDRVYFAGIAVIVGFNVIDTVPNDSLFPLSFLLMGILLGQSEAILKNEKLKRKARLRRG